MAEKQQQKPTDKDSSQGGRDKPDNPLAAQNVFKFVNKRSRFDKEIVHIYILGEPAKAYINEDYAVTQITAKFLNDFTARDGLTPCSTPIIFHTDEGAGGMARVTIKMFGRKLRPIVCINEDGKGFANMPSLSHTIVDAVIGREVMRKFPEAWWDSITKEDFFSLHNKVRINGIKYNASIGTVYPDPGHSVVSLPVVKYIHEIGRSATLYNLKFNIEVGLYKPVEHQFKMICSSDDNRDERNGTKDSTRTEVVIAQDLLKKFNNLCWDIRKNLWPGHARNIFAEQWLLINEKVAFNVRIEPFLDHSYMDPYSLYWGKILDEKAIAKKTIIEKDGIKFYTEKLKIRTGNLDIVKEIEVRVTNEGTPLTGNYELVLGFDAIRMWPKECWILLVEDNMGLEPTLKSITEYAKKLELQELVDYIMQPSPSTSTGNPEKIDPYKVAFPGMTIRLVD